MRTSAVWLLLVALAFLAACAGTDKKAPIRVAVPTPAPGKVPPPQPVGRHVVQTGETLYGIAFQHGLNAVALAAWNGLADPNVIHPGTSLRLTPPPRPARSLPESSREPESAPMVAWDWPVRGRILRQFDGTTGGKGMDIAGTRGTPIRAAAAGLVMYAGDGLRGYGKLIIIKHSDTLLSAYAHQDNILVAEGSRVALGQVVGRMGDSDAQRVLLHFEIREQGNPVNPLKYLPN